MKISQLNYSIHKQGSIILIIDLYETYLEPVSKPKIDSALTGIAGDGNASRGGISILVLTG
jgi:hypothetical protein